MKATPYTHVLDGKQTYNDLQYNWYNANNAFLWQHIFQFCPIMACLAPSYTVVTWIMKGHLSNEDTAYCASTHIYRNVLNGASAIRTLSRTIQVASPNVHVSASWRTHCIHMHTLYVIVEQCTHAHACVPSRAFSCPLCCIAWALYCLPLWVEPKGDIY